MKITGPDKPHIWRENFLVTLSCTLLLASHSSLIAGAANNGGRKAVPSSPGSRNSDAAAATSQKPALAPVQDKWAIIIGIDNFKDKTIPHLKFSTKDAHDFADFLVNKGNFAPDHVLMLLNENATAARIKDSIGDNWLPRRAAKDDLVLIYASTHGSPRELDVAGENFLVAYDTDPQSLFATGIAFEDLAPTVRKRTGCERVVLLLDACNSGAAKVDEKGLVRSRNFDIDSVKGEGEVVISSSGAQQSSYESKRYANGVFTKQLMAGLLSHGTDTSLSDAYAYVKQQVASEVKADRGLDQTPVLNSDWSGAALALLSVPAQPRKINGPAYNAANANQDESVDSMPVKDLETLAENGNVVAMVELGERYKSGNMVTVDYDEAKKWLSSASKAGDAQGTRQLALMLLNGQGGEADVLGAIDLLEQAASKHHLSSVSAARDLAQIYENGTGVQVDNDRAQKWYATAVEKMTHGAKGTTFKSALAALWLAECYRDGKGCDKNPAMAIQYRDQAVKHFQTLSAAGDCRAMVPLANCYMQGAGLPKDPEQAVHYYKTAADAGRTLAMTGLAHAYEIGEGLPKDAAQAVFWFKKAADHGDPVGEKMLGNCYLKGFGLAKDNMNAAIWYRKAAAQGDAGSQYDLATCYFDGLGVQTDLGEALKLNRMAAERGLASAQFRMGACYESGKGITADRNQAIDWYRRAARQNEVRATSALKRLGISV